MQVNSKDEKSKVIAFPKWLISISKSNCFQLSIAIDSEQVDIQIKDKQAPKYCIGHD